VSILDTADTARDHSGVDLLAGTPRAGPSAPGRGKGTGIRILRGLLSAVISIALVLGAWVLFLKIFHIKPFIGKTPVDVWHYLATSSQAAAHRREIFHESLTTLRDALLGMVAGTLAACICAVAFNLWRPAERAFMPIAMVLRSVPLVAMTPLIVLVFGRDLRAVTVIAGIVTFFPTLVNVTLALRWTPPDAMDLCRAYGASQFSTLRKVQVPNALPALMASLRIAAPLALVGALLAEWLATGKGLGYKMLQSGALSDYSGLWSRVFLVTLYSVLLYKLIGVVERWVLARFAPQRGT
jgi:ABC-type nitrate/sulfonate/bicarbonate transport system permease component